MTWPHLPFTLTPLPGESFDSWFEAYAARLQVTTGDLATALGLPDEYLRTTIGVLLTDGVTPRHLQQIAAATGLGITSLPELFHRPGPTPAAGKPVVTRAMRSAWAPAAGTRFCPACLADNGGRYTLAWRLPWTFFCLRHNQVLAEVCPQCHQPPRARPITVMRQPALGRCCTPAGRSRRTTSPCGADLTAVPSTELDTDQARRAQQVINDHVAHATAPEGQEHDALEALTDLTVIAHNLANPGRIGTRRVRAHMLNAATLTTAVDLLTGISRVEALAALVQRQTHPSRRTPAVPESWRPAGAALTARIAHGRDAHLTATERIRYATTLPAPMPSLRTPVDPALTRARWIPDQIWSAWAVRLTNHDSHDPVRMRPAAAVALLLPHSALKLPKAAALLSPHLRGDAVEHQLTNLAKASNGNTALRILTQLSLDIDAHGSPIDYAQRRRLVADTELIDAAAWKQVTHRSHYFIGGRRRLRFARCYLYELLTDGALSAAPPPYTLPTQIRAEYHEFVLGLPAPLVDALHDHARTLLVRRGITDEPLQWQPPNDWVTVESWPGADPDLTDPAPLHHALQQGDPASRVARIRGLSMEHLRHVIRRHPLPGREEPRLRPGAIVPSDTNTGTYCQVGGVHHVNLAWLREQYLTWQRTIADIADEIGCNSSNLAEFAKLQGILMRPRGGGPAFISRHTITTHPAMLPDLLRAALGGQSAHQRLERFRIIAEHGNLTQAANRIGINPSTLGLQLGRLETRCGGPLFRHPPCRLGSLTQLGEQLLQQAQQHLKPPRTEPRHDPSQDTSREGMDN